MPLVDVAPDESVLFHLAPQVAVKFRGLPDEKVAAATEAALSSYIASMEQVGTALDSPHIAFAFCYLAAQFGLGILAEQTVAQIMAVVEEDPERLGLAIARATHHE